MNKINEIIEDVNVITNAINDIIKISTDPDDNPIKIDLEKIKKTMLILESFKTNVEKIRDKFSVKYSFENKPNININKGFFEYFFKRIEFPKQDEYKISDDYDEYQSSYKNLINIFNKKTALLRKEIISIDNIINKLDSNIYKLNKFIYEALTNIKLIKLTDAKVIKLLNEIENKKSDIKNFKNIMNLEKIEQIINAENLYKKLVYDSDLYGDTFQSFSKINEETINRNIKIANSETDNIIINNMKLKDEIKNVNSKEKSLFEENRKKIYEILLLISNTKRDNIFNKTFGQKNIDNIYFMKETKNISLLRKLRDNILNMKASSGGQDRRYMDNIINLINETDLMKQKNIEIKGDLNNQINLNNEKLNKLNIFIVESNNILSIIKSDDYNKNIENIKKLLDMKIIDPTSNLNQLKSSLSKYISNLEDELFMIRKSIDDKFKLISRPTIRYINTDYQKRLIKLMVEQKIKFNNFSHNSLKFFSKIFDINLEISDDDSQKISKLIDIPLKDKWFMEWKNIMSGGKTITSESIKSEIPKIYQNTEDIFAVLYNQSILIDEIKIKYNYLYKYVEEFYTKSRDVIMYLLYEYTVIKDFSQEDKLFIGFLTYDHIERWLEMISKIKSDEKYKNLFIYYSVLIEKSYYLLYNTSQQFVQITNGKSNNVIDVYNSNLDTMLLLLSLQHFNNIILKI